MNIADMKGAIHAALINCSTDNERLQVMAAAIRAQARTLGKNRKEEAGRCLALMDAVDAYARGELSSESCRSVADGQPSDPFELVDISQAVASHVEKFAPVEGDDAKNEKDRRRLSSIIPALLHGCGVGDTPAARSAVGNAMMMAIVRVSKARLAREVRGAA